MWLSLLMVPPISLESGNRRQKLTVGMVVTNGIACALPDMLLGVEVRTGRREVKDVQTLGLVDQRRTAPKCQDHDPVGVRWVVGRA